MDSHRKRFACPKCSKSFTRKDSLKRHIDIQHPDPFYSKELNATGANKYTQVYKSDIDFTDTEGRHVGSEDNESEIDSESSIEEDLEDNSEDEVSTSEMEKYTEIDTDDTVDSESTIDEDTEGDIGSEEEYTESDIDTDEIEENETDIEGDRDSDIDSKGTEADTDSEDDIGENEDTTDSEDEDPELAKTRERLLTGSKHRLSQWRNGCSVCGHKNII